MTFSEPSRDDRRYTPLLGRPLAAYSCDRCGCVIDWQDIDLHNAWHIRMQELLAIREAGRP